MVIATEFKIYLPLPFEAQERFIRSPAKRRVIRAGRRSGKTTGAAILAVEAFLNKRRILYAVPVQDQVETFWREVKQALAEPLNAGVFSKNETLHTIEISNSNVRIRAKTAWDVDTLRGDYADLLILDEWQLMNEDAWGLVGAPMLLDNNGDAVFIYTPPSLHSHSVSKAQDPRHAAKLFTFAKTDISGRWASFHFTSLDNPYISKVALNEITKDMTSLAYRQEILAEDIEDAPGALWKRARIDELRVTQVPPLRRIVVAIDPEVASSAASSETGIMVAGVAFIGGVEHGYILEDLSLRASPAGWAKVAVDAYHNYKADRIVGEINQGGEMVEHTIRSVDRNISYKAVHASRGKQVRAEPISAFYEQGRVHHIGHFPKLEDQLCQWQPGDKSPDRLDALVWALSELMIKGTIAAGAIMSQEKRSLWRD